MKKTFFIIGMKGIVAVHLPIESLARQGEGVVVVLSLVYYLELYVKFDANPKPSYFLPSVFS